MDNNNVNYLGNTTIFPTLSMSFGIASLVILIILPPLTFPFGGLAILFAILSTGRSSSYSFHSKIGLITGSIGLCLIIILFIGTFYYMMSSPEFLIDFNLMYESMYGESFDDAMKQIIE